MLEVTDEYSVLTHTSNLNIGERQQEVTVETPYSRLRTVSPLHFDIIPLLSAISVIISSSRPILISIPLDGCLHCPFTEGNLMVSSARY